MKKSLGSYLRKKFRGSDISQTEDVNAIHQIARDYFSDNFPNPDRFGCPPKASFIKLIAESSLPDKDLQNHLLSCSECFNEYRAELGLRNRAVISKKNFSHFNIRFALAGGLIIILIALAVSFIWLKQNDSDSAKELVQNENTNANTEVSENILLQKYERNPNAAVENRLRIAAENNTNFRNRTNSAAKEVNKRKSSSAKEEDSLLLAKNGVRIDLTDPVFRDSSANASDRKVVRLKAKKTRLRIALPKENPAGTYQVFLADEFAKPLTEKKTVQTKDGNIIVDFDLSKIGGKQKRLCFAPVGEIPDCVLVNISGIK